VGGSGLPGTNDVFFPAEEAGGEGWANGTRACGLRGLMRICRHKQGV
jgi:hypothetical protein